MEKLTIDQFYKEGSSGRLLGLLCEKGHTTVPPRHSCVVCQSTSLEIVELSGKGKIATFTEVYTKSKDFPLDPPYVLGLVRLNEGPRLLAIVYNSKSGKREIEIGSQVKIRFLPILHSSGLSGGERPRIFADLEQP